jgi:acyl carrier protein
MTTSQHNDALLRNAFAQALVIDPSQVTDDLTYNSIAAWDSTAHMLLIAELENCFNVMLDTDDIIDMSSVAKAKTILQKYDIVFSE